MIPTSDFETYISVYDFIPKDWEDARGFITERLRDVTNGVNSRDYAQYIDRETLTGQSWIPGTGNEFRDVFRKVINIGPLPDFAVTNPKNVPHGITFSANTCITRFYGGATDRSGVAFTIGIPLPHVDPVASSNIGISIDNTNVIISGDGATDYSAYDCAYIVIEYIDQA